MMNYVTYRNILFYFGKLWGDIFPVISEEESTHSPAANNSRLFHLLQKYCSIFMLF